MLGLEYEFRRGGFLGVEYGGRHVMVQVSTFGVSPPLLKRHLAPAEMLQAKKDLMHVTEFRDKHVAATGRQPILLAGVDYLDRLKGVQLKLLAWEVMGPDQLNIPPPLPPTHTHPAAAALV